MVFFVFPVEFLQPCKGFFISHAVWQVQSENQMQYRLRFLRPVIPWTGLVMLET
jgi:hypothetical protein